jgi:ubiquinone/menaquinone biosynthesis C-methylase UbiE
MLRLTLDGALYRAPISENVQNVLDAGCGTRIWAIEFAEEFHKPIRTLEWVYANSSQSDPAYRVRECSVAI